MMAVTWTSAAIVKKRSKYINTTDLSDSDIESIINEAEGMVEGLMRKQLSDFTTTTFDAQKHGLIRSLVTDLATIKCLLYDPDESADNDQLQLHIESMLHLTKIQLALLSDTKRVDFISGL